MPAPAVAVNRAGNAHGRLLFALPQPRPPPPPAAVEAHHGSAAGVTTDVQSERVLDGPDDGGRVNLEAARGVPPCIPPTESQKTEHRSQQRYGRAQRKPLWSSRLSGGSMVR